MMYARVVNWEGSSGDALRAMADRINANEGPPEGVPAKGFMVLIDPDGGKSIAIALFDSEDDMRTGHETLEQMSPPEDVMGRRTSVAFYEVAVDVKAP